MNGFLKKNNKYFMWVGRRSKKGNFPNDLDQIAAGGLPFNVTVKKNLIKESYEEANIEFQGHMQTNSGTLLMEP